MQRERLPQPDRRSSTERDGAVRSHARDLIEHGRDQRLRHVGLRAVDDGTNGIAEECCGPLRVRPAARRRHQQDTPQTRLGEHGAELRERVLPKDYPDPRQPIGNTAREPVRGPVRHAAVSQGGRSGASGPA